LAGDPHEKREELLRQLNKLGINRRTLFPDLDGVAEFLRWDCRRWPANMGIVPHKP